MARQSRMTIYGARWPVRPFIADILFNQDFVIWCLGPAVASLALLLAGLLVRRRSPRTGLPLVVVGAGGLVLSAAWLAFLFYVDALLGDT
jgi:hypothetical protein